MLVKVAILPDLQVSTFYAMWLQVAVVAEMRKLRLLV